MPAPSPRPHPPLRFPVEGLVYELDQPPRVQGRRSVVTVRLDEHLDDPGFVDRVDLYAFRSRQAFAGRVADAFGREAGAILGHLALLLDAVERAAPEAAPAQDLTEPRRRAAEKLLAAPDLLDRAAQALEALGHVGEENVKRLCYLAATSRLLDRPVNVLLLAPPGTGKSTVLDAVTALMPPEQVVSLARLTPQALFYMGPDALRHRLVVVDEYEGQADADHAVRVLQSRGELTMSATVKGRAQSFTVRGPVAVMSGTTSSDLDPQNTSRCLELALDDSPAQTRRVQEALAQAWSSQRTGLDPEPWQDAQRLLAEEAPLRVTIPYAPRLQFQARTSTDRRAFGRLLGLVAAHAALHVRQREQDQEGRVVASVEDYRAVHGLLRADREREVEGLSPRAARVYQLLAHEPQGLDRRAISRALGWCYNTARKGLAELEAQELVKVTEAGPPAKYRVLDRSLLSAGACDLLDPAALAVARPSARRRPRARRA